MEKLKVAILGATGIVGQRLVSLLHRHPWFEVEGLYASKRHHGRRYSEAVEWVLEEEIPESIADTRVYEADPESLSPRDYDLVFSALPSDVARSVEPVLAKKGFVVVSNSSAYRLDSDVPLIVPEVNPDHIYVAGLQEGRGWRGRIYKVPNCTTIILSLTLKPLLDRFGLSRVIVSSMQAVSGAGLRGVPSLYILDNLVPFIEGEEEKVEAETLKILSSLEGGRLRDPGFIVSASTHRVPVLEGHTIAVFVETREEADPVEASKAMEGFKPSYLGKTLPSAPPRPLKVRRENDRPQPRLDRMEGNGMTVVVGRIRRDRALGGVKYVAMGSNTVRGAAGNAVLIAELLASSL